MQVPFGSDAEALRQPRRTHRKSRFGCLSCKRRRVKCDESGPPCGPCRNRSTVCEYAGARPGREQEASSTASSTAGISGRRSRSGTGTEPTTDPSTAPSAGISPPDNSLTPASTSSSLQSSAAATKSLELELMHQWSTVSYKTICGSMEDQYEAWQTIVPRVALKYDFVLNGLFAYAALEIAALSEEGTNMFYVNRALEYQNLALTQFRVELSTVSETNHQALYILSSMLIALGLGMSRFLPDQSTMTTILLLFELVGGGGALVLAKENCIRDDPLLNTLTPWEHLVSIEPEPSVRAALDRLVELNDLRHGSSSNHPRAAVLQAIGRHTTCRRAIFFLEECFTKCAQPATRGYALGWLNMVGREFTQALEEKEHIALLILMHFGVLLDQQAYGIWWVQDIGRNLIEELSGLLQDDEDPQVMQGLAWAREKVGLVVAVDDQMETAM